MANEKTGFAYYNNDTDRFMDIRIKRLKRAYGCNGYAVYSYILNEVYRVKGAALIWNDATRFDVSEYWDLTERDVDDIVDYCGEIGLFSKEMLDKGYITSAAIQKRYIDMCARARRKAVVIPEEYRIITKESTKITEECGKITEECPNPPTFCDKEKKRKEKENNTLSLSPSGEVEKNELTEQERKEIFEFFYWEKNLKYAKEESERFIAHYEANGWCRGNSDKPVKSKVALAKLWDVKLQETRWSKNVNDWLHKIYKTAKQNKHETLLYGIEKIETDKEGMTWIYCAKNIAELINAYIPSIQPSFGKIMYRIKKTNN